MDELKVLIADDERPARKRLTALLQSVLPDASVIEATNGRQALELVRSVQPDLVFLDIQMPECSGMQVVQEIGPARMPLTIFVTAYDKHAIDAFEANALDYLLKPYSDERFEAAFERAKRRLYQADLSKFGERLLHLSKNETLSAHYLERLAVKEKTGTRLIPTEKLESIEGAGAYVSLHTRGEKYLYRGTLASLAKLLNPDSFVRVHRSAIVNIAAILFLEPTSHGDFEATLKSGRHVQISRTFRAELEKRLRQTF